MKINLKKVEKNYKKKRRATPSACQPALRRDGLHYPAQLLVAGQPGPARFGGLQVELAHFATPICKAATATLTEIVFNKKKLKSEVVMYEDDLTFLREYKSVFHNTTSHF